VLGILRAARQPRMPFLSNSTRQWRALPRHRGGGREFSGASDDISSTNFHSASSILSGPILSRSSRWRIIAGGQDIGPSDETVPSNFRWSGP
jgi:hypothetical protein